MSKIDKSLFWNPAKLLSYNRIFNIAIGSRGCGKTFSCKLLCIKDFIVNGNQFIYLRRTEEELKTTKDSFFRDIIKEGYYTNYTLEVSGNEFLINGKIAGFAFALSTGKTRSLSLPNVKTILFDEFIRDGRNRGGVIRDEVGLLINFYETVDRARDETRVIMLSNSHSVVNVYFVKWKVRLNEGAIFTKVGDEIIIEVVNNPAFKDAKRNTRFGKFLSGTDEGRHIIDNEFTNDNKAFVAKIKGEKRNYVCTITHNSRNIGVWYYTKLGYYYCSEETLSQGFKFAFTTFDQKVNMIMVQNARSNVVMKSIIDSVEYGMIYYSSLAVKNTILTVIGMV